MPTNQHIIYTLQAVHSSLMKRLQDLEDKIAALDVKLEECMSEADTEYTINSDAEDAEENSDEDQLIGDMRVVIVVDNNGNAFTSE